MTVLASSLRHISSRSASLKNSSAADASMNLLPGDLVKAGQLVARRVASRPLKPSDDNRLKGSTAELRDKARQLMMGSNKRAPGQSQLLQMILGNAVDPSDRLKQAQPLIDEIKKNLVPFALSMLRRSVLGFHGGYHGQTHGALALMGNLGPKVSVPGLMPDVHFLPYPYVYRHPFGPGGKADGTDLSHYVEAVLSDITRQQVDEFATGAPGAALSNVCAEANHNPELAAVVRQAFRAKREELARGLRRGIADGQLRADLDIELMLDLLLAVFPYRLLVSGEPVPGDLAARLPRALLDGARP